MSTTAAIHDLTCIPVDSLLIATAGPSWAVLAPGGTPCGVLPERTSAWPNRGREPKGGCGERLDLCRRVRQNTWARRQTDIPHVPRVSPRWAASYTGSSAHARAFPIPEVPDSRNSLPFLPPGICNPTGLESLNYPVLKAIRWPATPRLGASTGPRSSQEFGVRFSRPS